MASLTYYRPGNICYYAGCGFHGPSQCGWRRDDVKKGIDRPFRSDRGHLPAFGKARNAARQQAHMANVTKRYTPQQLQLQQQPGLNGQQSQ